MYYQVIWAIFSTFIGISSLSVFHSDVSSCQLSQNRSTHVFENCFWFFIFFDFQEVPSWLLSINTGFGKSCYISNTTVCYVFLWTNFINEKKKNAEPLVVEGVTVSSLSLGTRERMRTFDRAKVIHRFLQTF